RLVPPAKAATATGANVSNVSDGIWYFAVRALDKAGNWGPVGHFRLQLDRVAPRVAWLSPNRFTFNPYKGPTTVRFRVNSDASTRALLYRVGSSKPVATYSYPHLR